RCLETEGIEYVFGVPGEENADFMLSLDASRRIRFVLTRHEQGAAFMAEVYGRLTGNPAVCLGTLGPGATNLVTGVADANMDRAPMLALTGQADSGRRHKESHQSMDVVSMFRPITKWANSILHPDTIPEVVRKAVRLARTEKPGACHIELPEDIAGLEAATLPIPPRRFRRSPPDEESLNRAVEMVRASRRPVILAGNGCIRKRASRQLRALCRQTGMGVISTFMAKGCVDMDDESCLYSIGLQARDVVACAMEAADLVLAVGYDMVEYPPRFWNADGEQRIIHLDFLPAEIDAQYRPEVELVGDVAQSLELLARGVASGEPLNFDLSQQAAVRREMGKDLALHRDDDTTDSIRPQKAIWDARQALGPSDILLSDVGAHKMWVARYYHCHEPNTCLIPNGFCSMGFALLGAIAAHLVFPERRILALCGDAGFLMNVQEMETARRLNARMVAMIWQDNAYGLIQWKQQTAFGRHVDLSFGNPDFVKLAESFGWRGYECRRSRDLRKTLEEAFAGQGPALVAIPIDYRENDLLTTRLGDIVCPI
ncbi:MAG: acetolactate synthase large subunit, partial [Acidobacteriota bacterium]